MPGKEVPVGTRRLVDTSDRSDRDPEQDPGEQGYPARGRLARGTASLNPRSRARQFRCAPVCYSHAPYHAEPCQEFPCQELPCQEFAVPRVAVPGAAVPGVSVPRVAVPRVAVPGVAGPLRKAPRERVPRDPRCRRAGFHRRSCMVSRPLTMVCSASSACTWTVPRLASRAPRPVRAVEPRVRRPSRSGEGPGVCVDDAAPTAIGSSDAASRAVAFIAYFTRLGPRTGSPEASARRPPRRRRSTCEVPLPFRYEPST